MILYDLVWSVLTRYNIVWFDMIRCNLIRFDSIQRGSETSPAAERSKARWQTQAITLLLSYINTEYVSSLNKCVNIKFI